ncbi:hypothetical protein TNCV_602431 [Trichonephila clavipes]|nr:hypothetical protein TNCV_602431 [Trichonephila clavipes]
MCARRVFGGIEPRPSGLEYNALTTRLPTTPCSTYFHRREHTTIQNGRRLTGAHDLMRGLNPRFEYMVTVLQEMLTVPSEHLITEEILISYQNIWGIALKFFTCPC